MTSVLACLGMAAALVLDTKYHPDLMFQEFACYWDGGQCPNFCPTNFPGATVYVYVKTRGRFGDDFGRNLGWA